MLETYQSGNRGCLGTDQSKGLVNQGKGATSGLINISEGKCCAETESARCLVA